MTSLAGSRDVFLKSGGKIVHFLLIECKRGAKPYNWPVVVCFWYPVPFFCVSDVAVRLKTLSHFTNHQRFTLIETINNILYRKHT